MTVRIPKLERLKQFVQGIGGTHRVFVTGLTGPSREKLNLLRDSGRPFMLITPGLRRAAMVALRAELARAMRAGDLRTARVLEPAAKAMKEHIIERFLRGGLDVRLRRLSPATLAMKRARGWDLRIGIATGTLLRNLRRSQWHVEKRR